MKVDVNQRLLIGIHLLFYCQDIEKLVECTGMRHGSMITEEQRHGKKQ